MKKSLSILLSIILIISICPLSVFEFTASAETVSGSCGENATWEYDTFTRTLTIYGTGTINDYSFTESDITVEYITTAPWRFYFNAIKALVINTGITKIGNYAFYYCIGLTSITIPESVTSIGNYAFSGCTGITSITIPDGVTEINRGLFYNCTGLTSITIPDSVTSIGSSSFSGCTGLKSITIPESVTSIGDYAFYGCTGLTSVTIPDSVTEIGGSAFSGCTGLTSVTIPDSVTRVGDGAFNNTAWYNNQPDGLVYAGKVAYRYKGTCPVRVTINNGTLGIASYAFFGCTGLMYIDIPDSVTAIGSGAFMSCTRLKYISLSHSVTSIGGYTFSGCAGLTSFTILDSVTSIGDGAFNGCTGLTSIIIPDKVTSIGSSSFSGCTRLTSITIPNSVTTIGSYAFNGCSRLTSIAIPNSVTSIENYTFCDCQKLSSIIVPNSILTIASSSFCNCNGLKDVYYTGTEQQSFDIIIYNELGYNDSFLNATWHYNYCAHANTVVKNAKAATCTAAGYTGDTYCEDCGEKIADAKAIQKLAHKPSDWKVVKAAAIGVAGSKQKVCTVCKAVLETATIDALPYPTYTITYKLDGGKNASGNPKTYKHNAADITLKNPTKKGYKFEGWYIGTKKVTKIAKGTNKNITLTAKWTKDTYKITYKLAGGKKVKNPATYTVTTSTIKLKSPTKKGYKFVGWYNGSKKVTEIKKGSTGNLTLTAKWTAIDYKITYKLNEGKNNSKNPKKYTVTSSTIKLKNPTRKGYTFKGWYNGKKKVTQIKKGSTGSITLTAKWKKK